MKALELPVGAEVVINGFPYTYKGVQKINFIAGYLANDYYKQFWQVKALLKDYCNALESYWNFTDDQIVNDLETEVKKQGNECHSFYQFSLVIEGWINDIKKGK